MRTIVALLLSIVLLHLTGCEDKKHDTKIISAENTTELITEQDRNKYTSNSNSKNSDNAESTIFTLKSTQDISYIFSISKNSLQSNLFDGQTLVLNFIDINSSISLDQMESLSKIQNKNINTLKVISVHVGDTLTLTTPNVILNKKHIYHFVSLEKGNTAFSQNIYKSLKLKPNTALPLSIIYKKGAYYSHFEGPVPIEMIHSDIKQTMKK